MLPKLGSKPYEEMIDFMRTDLESNMGYTKIILAARKKIEEEGRDFDAEFEIFKKNKCKT